jgi:hypothetical protein
LPTFAVKFAGSVRVTATLAFSPAGTLSPPAVRAAAAFPTAPAPPAPPDPVPSGEAGTGTPGFATVSALGGRLADVGDAPDAVPVTFAFTEVLAAAPVGSPPRAAPAGFGGGSAVPPNRLNTAALGTAGTPGVDTGFSVPGCCTGFCIAHSVQPASARSHSRKHRNPRGKQVSKLPKTPITYAVSGFSSRPNETIDRNETIRSAFFPGRTPPVPVDAGSSPRIVHGATASPHSHSVLHDSPPWPIIRDVTFLQLSHGPLSPRFSGRSY